MNTTTVTTDANIAALLEALTYENWFTQLAVLSDAYREAGYEAKADRCDDLRLAGKIPYIRVDKSFAFYPTQHQELAPNGEYVKRYMIPSKTYIFMREINRDHATFCIKSQLTAYLQVPEHLRIARPKS